MICGCYNICKMNSKQEVMVPGSLSKEKDGLSTCRVKQHRLIDQSIQYGRKGSQCDVQVIAPPVALVYYYRFSVRVCL